MFERFIGSLFITAAIAVGLLIIFAITSWLTGWQLPALTPSLALDIGMGVVCFIWLLLILTVPWDIHFQAKSVQFEMERSREAGLAISDERFAYVQRTQRTTLWVALALHLFSAAIIGGLAYVTRGGLGYWFAGFYLATMVFRPVGAAYSYLHSKLADIGQEAKFPRDDTLKLKGELEQVKSDVVEIRAHIETITKQLKTLEATADRSHQDILALRQSIERAEQSFKSRIGQMSDEIERSITRTFDQQDIVNGLRAFARLVKSA
ncbi:MAG: hypothetical protein SNJ67_01300 [Chloracidobacterium sp.]|uniref:Uncharacterized protein n=1 Tax=Chloracidobacterium validum TaxID=2821543 RepID=A0ABX8BB44_9BACT|nr:hypothetical protein [Chloracidobacterium validum]QUW02863.1 hypothetical protein J8C06_11115 [Chloracidobacterium validum]